MTAIGNILWFIFGGFIAGLSWFCIGILWCISIIGIRVGIQCLKMASLSFLPFGKDVQYGGGGISFLLNILWFIFGGLFLAIEFLVFGIVLCITIIGIPFGKQFFKLAQLALMPFGANIVRLG